MRIDYGSLTSINPQKIQNSNRFIIRNPKSKSIAFTNIFSDYRVTMVLFIIICLTLATPALGFVGYDCGAKSLNITTVSLLDVENCDIPQPTVNSTRKYINLIQLNHFMDTKVIQCKVQISRTVYRCGMWSHVSVVNNGYNEYMLDLDGQTCKDLHKYGELRISSGEGAKSFRQIKMNQTTVRPVTLAGRVENDGECIPATYSDAYGTWEKVVVIGTVRITVQEYTASISLNDNKIRLRSGVRCDLTEEHCIDSDGGNTYWDSLPFDTCDMYRYGSLFRGYANKIVDDDHQTIYSLTTGEVTFALIARGVKRLCGYELFGTEHPRLFVFETNEYSPFTVKEGVSLSNLDIFIYVNSKFVFVEKYMKTQISNLYRDVILHRCRQEREIIKNSLAIATLSPDQFAYNLMKGPGYMAVLAGEVVHLIKCLPVDVSVAQGDECYSELKVIHNNETKFLTPKTHILKSYGTQVDCNALLPTYYYFNEDWYKFMPRAVETKQPTTLKPYSALTWKYQDIPTMATSGIYTQKDLEELLNRIMMPMDSPGVINDITREIRGRAVRDHDGLISKLLTESAMEKLVNNTWNKMWSNFMTFGTFSAGVIAVLIIIQTIKKAIEVLINGIALHSIYGWSFHLVGAVWNSVTAFLIHLGPRDERSTSDIEQPFRTATCPAEERTYYPSHKIEEEIRNAESLPLQPKNTLGFLPKSTN